MDGMNWLSANDADAVARQRGDRRAFRTAMRMTVLSVVLGLAFVFALSVLGLVPPAEEFPSPPPGPSVSGAAS